MTQEEQTALVDGQQAAAAPNSGAGDTPSNAGEPTKNVESEQPAEGEGKTSNGTSQEGDESHMRLLFKQIIRMRSVRKLSPAAKAAKAARQAARAAENAAKAAEVAAKAADSAAKAAQDAAQAAFEENAKVAEVEKKPDATVGQPEADKQPEQVAAK